MRRILIVLLSVLLCLLVSACGKAKTDTVTEGNSDISSAAVDNTQAVDKTEPVLSELTEEYKIPGKNIYMMLPDWMTVEKGMTYILYSGDTKYIAVTGCVNNNASSLDEAHNISYEKFVDNIQNYSYVDELTVIKDETVTINGNEFYFFEGEFTVARDYVNRDNNYKCYCVGYSFIMDNVPCSIIGSVMLDEDPQPEEQINDVREKVKLIVESLSDKK